MFGCVEHIRAVIEAVQVNHPWDGTAYASQIAVFGKRHTKTMPPSTPDTDFDQRVEIGSEYVGSKDTAAHHDQMPESLYGRT